MSSEPPKSGDEATKNVVETAVETVTSAESIDQTCQLKHASKRQYLEVNNAETVKKLLVKPTEIKRVKPSETLAKVREFLPLLKESTSRLMDEFKANPERVDIENVEEGDEHIEMNLALMPQGDSDSDSDDGEEDESEDEEETEESDDETNSDLEELELGFKVKDPNRLKKLKLAKTSSGTKKSLISEIGSEDKKQEEESNEVGESKTAESKCSSDE